jgi:hypothetical protein
VVVPLKVTTLPGFHVNSDKPRGEYLIPFKVSWTPGPLQAGQVTYPEPQMMKVGQDTLSVFTGTFVVQTAVTAPDGVAAGPVSLVGKVHYQACNDQMCFRPATAEVKVPVTIR